MSASVKYALFSALFLSTFSTTSAKNFLCSLFGDVRNQFSLCPLITIGGHYDGNDLRTSFMKKFHSVPAAPCSELSDITAKYDPEAAVLMFKDPKTKHELVHVDSGYLLEHIGTHCMDPGIPSKDIDNPGYAIYAFEKPNKAKDGITMKVSVKNFPELASKEYYVTLNRDDTIESILDKMKVIWQNQILFDGWAKLVFRFEWLAESKTRHFEKIYTTDEEKKLIYDDIQIASIGRDSVTLEIHGATALKKASGNVKWAKLN